MTTVLIAHGNTLHLRDGVEALQELGLEVTATPDGGDAFARFFEESPAVVVCSAVLPSLSGPNFARMVRSQSPETPVVILGEVDPGEQLDGVHLLPDPLDVDRLRETLGEALIPLPSQKAARVEEESPQRGPTEVFVLAALRRFQRDNNLLALLDDAGIQKMARIAEHRVREDGERLIQQGDSGDGFYFLVEGQVKVTLAEKDDAEVARIRAGGFFGEMALLSDRPRSASVWAVGPVTLLWFQRDRFVPLLDDYQMLQEVLSGVALKRTEENLWRVLFDDADVQKSLEEISADAALDLAASGAGRLDVTAPSALLAAASGTDARPTATDEDLHPDGHSSVPSPFEDPSDDAIEAPLETRESTMPDKTVVTPSPAVPADAPAWLDDPSDEASHADTQPRIQLDITEELTAPGLALTQTETTATPWGHVRAFVTSPSHMRTLAVGFSVGLVVGILLTLATEDRRRAPDVAPVAVAPITPTNPVTPRPKAQPEPPAAESAKTVEPTELTEPTKTAPDPTLAEETTPSLEPVPEPAAPFVVERWTATRPLNAAQESERKAVRRQFVTAVKKKRYGEAVRLGIQLRDGYRLDWEAHWLLGEALRGSGQSEEALKAYLAFADAYPENARAVRAQFAAAELWEQLGATEAARDIYQGLAASAEGRFREQAQRKLSTLQKGNAP